MDQRLSPVAFTASVEFRGAPADDGTRAFSGVAYGGGVVTDHPYLPSVVFDLSSTTLETPAPALFSHYDPIGVIETAAIGERIEIGGKLFADLDGNAKKVAAMADRGLPWQLSVGIWPGRIEEAVAGVKVQLNGRSFDGPLTIFRDNRVREVSFVALGADDKTSAKVFAAVSEGGRRTPTQPPEQAMPDITKEEHDRVVGDLNAKFDAEKARADAAEQALAAHRATVRLTAVKELFTATGREFSGEKAKPYLAMDDESFAAVAADLKAGRPAADQSLFHERATGGAGEGAGDTAASIRQKAEKFMADQAAIGRAVSVSDAVAHVTGKAKVA